MLQNSKRRSQMVKSERLASKKERDAIWAAELRAARGSEMSATEWLKAHDRR